MPAKRKRKRNEKSVKPPEKSVNPPALAINWKDVLRNESMFPNELIKIVEMYLYSIFLMIGGYESIDKNVDRWNRVEQKWDRLSPLTHVRYAASTFFDPQNEQLCVVGGRNRVNQVERTIEQWNRLSQTFTTLQKEQYKNLCSAMSDYSLFFETKKCSEGLLLNFESNRLVSFSRYSIIDDHFTEKLPEVQYSAYISNRGHHCMEWDSTRQRLWCLTYDRYSSYKNRWQLHYYDDIQHEWSPENDFPQLDVEHENENNYVNLHLMPDFQSILVFGGVWHFIWQFDITKKLWSNWADKPVSIHSTLNSLDLTDRYACGSIIIDFMTLVWIDHKHDWHQWDLATKEYKFISTHYPNQRSGAFATLVTL
jgi:hypothetical protein